MRVPMVMVSAYIAPGTIVNTVAQAHLVRVRPCPGKWGLPTLTARDQAAPDFGEVFTPDDSRGRPRPGPCCPTIPCPRPWFAPDSPQSTPERAAALDRGHGGAPALPRARRLGLDATRLETVGDAAGPDAQGTPAARRPRADAAALLAPAPASAPPPPAQRLGPEQARGHRSVDGREAAAFPGTPAPPPR